MSNAHRWSHIYKELGVTELEFDNRPLGAYIEEHAANRPDAPALFFFARSFSYAEYNAEVNRLANALSAAGIGPGDAVGMHMVNIPQYAFALGAVSKLGAVGVSVSPLMTPKELAYVLEDSGVRALISLADLAPVLGATQLPGTLDRVIVTGATDFLAPAELTLPSLEGVDVQSYLDLVDEASDAFSQVEVQPDDTFVIKYTGGTTGRSKGAQLSHRNVIFNTVQASAFDPAPEIGAEVVTGAFPLFHVAGLAYIVYSIRIGGGFTLLPDPRNIDQFCATMKQNPPTRIAAVPALYQMLQANPAFAEIDFSRLRIARTGGAPMTITQREQLSAVLGQDKLSDAFGMTETSPSYVANPGTRYRMGSVGVPLPGADVRIVDVETGTKELPAGEPGEIITAGPHVMKGYLKRPEEDAIVLRELDGKTFMYSGDVGYMDEEGYVFICDRIKDMLVVGGFKVFSVEVEDVLNGLPSIAACAVVGSADQDRPGNDVVNLFVQLSPDHQGRDQAEVQAEIEGYAQDHLAAYKKPRAIHFVDAIPLTPVNKIDKKLLRAQLEA